MAYHDHSHSIVGTDGDQAQGCQSDTCGRSMREFLSTLGAFAVSAFVPGGVSIAQTSPPTTKSGLIDLHHILPPVYLSEVRDLMIASWKLTAQQQSYLPARDMRI